MNAIKEKEVFNWEKRHLKKTQLQAQIKTG